VVSCWWGDRWEVEGAGRGAAVAEQTSVRK